MALNVVALARTAEFQKVMLTGPFALVKADSGQLGNVVAAPAGVADMVLTVDTAVMLVASTRDPASDLKSGIGFMTVCLPPWSAGRGAGDSFHRARGEAAHQLFLEDQQQDHQWEEGDDGAGQSDIDGVGLRADELLQSDLDGVEWRAGAPRVGDHQWPAILVPGGQEGEDG